MNRSHQLLAALLVLSSTRTSSEAATLKVPSAYPTIQSAIVAAAPGDTVRVAPGTYHERVVIPSTKTGLRLRGTGKVILDAIGTGPGAIIAVDAAEARIENLTLTHASSSGPDSGIGVWVLAGGAGTTIRDVNVIRAELHGITLYPPSCVVRDCRIVGGRRGIAGHPGATDGLVTGCEVVRTLDYGIELMGDRARIEKNVIRGQSDNGAGIRIEGDDSIVAKNTIEGCNAGILATMSSIRSVIRQNDVTANRTYGLYVVGIESRVEKNTISNCATYGIRLAGDDPVVVGNVVEECGDGVENNTPNSRFTKNIATKNRIDVAMSQAPASFEKNTYHSGGPTTPPEID